jgi:lysozyme family protein
MKENFDRSLTFILVDEGGFSNIPQDKGHATNQGIILNTLMEYHKIYDYGDMDNDGDIDINDIKLLDKPEEVAPIYKKWYWGVIKGDNLPSGIDYVTFDSAVNHGPRNAGIFLQRAANRYQCNLIVDGKIGELTLNCVSRVGANQLIVEILNERDIFYNMIVACHPEQEIFIKGWRNRLSHVAINARKLMKGEIV